MRISTSLGRSTLPVIEKRNSVVVIYFIGQPQIWKWLHIMIAITFINRMIGIYIIFHVQHIQSVSLLLFQNCYFQKHSCHKAQE